MRNGNRLYNLPPDIPQKDQSNTYSKKGFFRLKNLQIINIVKLFIKFTIAIFLLLTLYRLGSIDNSLVFSTFSKPYILVYTLICLFLGIVLGGIRWWILLYMSGHYFSLATALQLQLMGSFFSTYLPGAAGGDLIRGAYILKAVRKNEGRTSAILSIVVDRIFALLGLILVGAAAAAYIFLSEFHVDGLDIYTNAISILIVISPIGMLSMVAGVLFFPKLSIFNILPSRIRMYFIIISELSAAYTNHWILLLACMLISIVASAIVIIGIIFIATAFPFAPDYLITAIAGVFGNVFSAIPITPGGVGVGETAFSSVCHKLTETSAPFASIYLTFRLLMFIANIPGGGFAIIDRIRPKFSTARSKANLKTHTR
ncbi:MULTISPECIES: lysylphosphatidylglycerol synthase transmembrane domain-containing protein [unclassified Brucella]|uniref:lysylphosphatidylglycerol synthase transmembrane domain-containing protein n=1 Tax=unclassified Brucella TaxID=2632610 RepID=UPI001FCE7A18|nr:lysylphosphatidylglycerol synthase transmembrane domain-containing protein [Brucella sp. 191011898]